MSINPECVIRRTYMNGEMQEQIKEGRYEDLLDSLNRLALRTIHVSYRAKHLSLKDIQRYISIRGLRSCGEDGMYIDEILRTGQGVVGLRIIRIVEEGNSLLITQATYCSSSSMEYEYRKPEHLLATQLSKFYKDVKLEKL